MRDSLASYTDIQSVLDAALAVSTAFGEECGRIPFTTYGEAVHWRQRAYRFRKKWRELRDPTNSIYDQLTLPKLEQGQTHVVIKRLGKVTTFIPARQTAIEADDELMQAALNVRKNLEGDL